MKTRLYKIYIKALISLFFKYQLEIHLSFRCIVLNRIYSQFKSSHSKASWSISFNKIFCSLISVIMHINLKYNFISMPYSIIDYTSYIITDLSLIEHIKLIWLLNTILSFPIRKTNIKILIRNKISCKVFFFCFVFLRA